MDYRAQLLALAETYSAATGLAEATVATRAYDNGGFFGAMRCGKTCTVDTFLKVCAWFRVHWPPGVAWPAEVTGIAIPPAPVPQQPETAA